ncbi:hypothetical protein CDV31_008754, partial [Fusarium ambrosium]
VVPKEGLWMVRLQAYTDLAPAVPGERLNWRSEIRAVTSERRPSFVRLTGIGYLRYDSLRASDDADVSYTDSQQDLKRYDLPYSFPKQSRTFTFHQSCWEILISQLESLTGQPQEPQRIAKHLFNLLFCLPRDHFHVPFPAHDFGGAFDVCNSPEVLPQPWKFLLADPNACRTRLSRQALNAYPDLFQNSSDGTLDCFSRLPIEVNHFIFDHLPSTDLCNLRLSSREVAGIAKPTQLPQSFWASRFSRDKEMNFFPLKEYFSASTNSTTDWRLLYVRIAHSLQDKTFKGHLRNRQRIWQCVGHLTQCLVPLLKQTRSLRNGRNLEREFASRGYHVGQVARGVDREDASVQGVMGISLFGTQSLLFRAIGYEAKMIQVSVSFITFDCAKYVSGIRVLERCGANATMELCRAGLIMPYSEESIIITPKMRLTGIQVASSISGIVGLGFLLQDEGRPAILRTAGIIENPPDGVGIATLGPRAGHELSGLLIGLDACKFVSLQLLELWTDPGPSERGSSDVTCARPWFWHPAEPHVGDSKTSLHMPEAGTRLSIPTFALDMDFGGADGSRLSRLNRIVAFHDDGGGSFRGFAFFYTDGSEESFGMKDILHTASKRWTCIEQSLALDGPGGERIVKLGMSRDNAGFCKPPQVIKMFTNYGRVLEFRRQTITGILATAQPPNGSLQSLGLRCLADVPAVGLNSRLRPSQTTRTFPTGHCRMNKPPWVLPTSTSCFTYVVLSKIRRIGVSTGIAGRTRRQDHVSGLCFEFWDSGVPVYVGQWFHEVGSLCLERGERVTSFAFWKAHENRLDGDNNGTITGIKISKTSPRQSQVEIRVGSKYDVLVYSFSEKPDERLRRLAWCFDHQRDYIYVPTRK